MMHIEFAALSGVAALLGLAIYLGACIHHRARPPIEKVVEALGFGGLIPVGFRMIYAAFVPEWLCSLIDVNKKLVENSALSVTFGEHTWEIIVGGVCIIIASCYSLEWLCRKPAHR